MIISGPLIKGSYSNTLRNLCLKKMISLSLLYTKTTWKVIFQLFPYLREPTGICFSVENHPLLCLYGFAKAFSLRNPSASWLSQEYCWTGPV